MISFHTAPTVAAGDRITSTQLAGLLTPANERLLYGFGTWRLFRYWIGLFRSMRNSSADGFLNPAEFEAISLLTLNPKDAEFPATGGGVIPADEPEGARLDNPLCGFIFGNAAWDLFSESERLTDPDTFGCTMTLDGADPVTPQDFWDLRKWQSGAWDTFTGDVACPALTAANSFAIQFNPKGAAATSWGGYMPGPAYKGYCDDESGSYTNTLSFEYIFTRLSDSYQVVYNGTCPNVPGDVAAVITGRYNYEVLRYTADPVVYTRDVYPRSEWMEGPYTGAVYIRHTEGHQIERVLSRFANEYRGSNAQRPGNTYNLDHSFGHGRFLSKQYLLSPQIGRSDGTVVVPVYERFAWQVASAAGTLAAASGGGYSHVWDEQCVLTSYLVTGEFLGPSSVSFQVLDGDTVLSTHTFTPTAGTHSEVVMLTTAVRPEAFKVRLVTALTFTDSAGYLGIEVDERMAYLPNENDRYFLLRACGSIDNVPDGVGTDENFADSISDNYFRYGAAVNIHAQAPMPFNEGSINRSGIYDAARRLAQMIRLVRRQNFVGYEVTSEGNSVLYFTRYFMGLAHDTPVDLFEGIGPDRLPKTQGSLTPGRTYIVRDSPITYANLVLGVDSTFEAQAADVAWTGAGNVYEYDGTISTAFKTGWTNEWLLDVDLLHYATSESSLWKPDAYSDIIWYSNRCQFDSYGLRFDRDLKWQAQYGGKYFYNPEMPSEWNYVKGSNMTLTTAEQLRRYKSCRIYEPPLKVKSARVIIEHGDQVVRIELDGRLHNTSAESGGAPSSFGRDLSTWTDAYTAEATTFYRTAENGLREYLYYASTGNNCAPGVIGDSATDATIWFDPDSPFGACFPSFRFTRLLGLPYDDGNDDQNVGVDSPFLHDSLSQLEVVIRAICEGFVDGPTTNLYGCPRTDADLTQCNVSEYGLYDFTYENLCYAATGNPYLQLLDISVRPDNVECYGPIPNTPAYSSMFNALSAMLNKLDTVRIMLPVYFESNVDIYADNHPTRITGADGSDPDFTDVSAVAGYWEGVPPAATTVVTPGSWTPGEITVTEAAAISADTGSGDDWIQQSTAERGSYRLAFTDPASVAALPPTISDMAVSHGGVLCCIVRWTTTTSKELTDAANSTPCGSPPQTIFSNGAGQYWKFSNPTTHTAECRVLTSGTAAAAPVGHAILVVGRTASAGTCFSGASNGLLISPWDGDVGAIVIPLV